MSRESIILTLASPEGLTALTQRPDLAQAMEGCCCTRCSGRPISNLAWPALGRSFVRSGAATRPTLGMITPCDMHARCTLKSPPDVALPSKAGSRDLIDRNAFLGLLRCSAALAQSRAWGRYVLFGVQGLHGLHASRRSFGSCGLYCFGQSEGTTSTQAPTFYPGECSSKPALYFEFHRPRYRQHRWI